MAIYGSENATTVADLVFFGELANQLRDCLTVRTGQCSCHCDSPTGGCQKSAWLWAAATGPQHLRLVLDEYVARYNRRRLHRARYLRSPARG